jgi:hypothetical protein
MDIEELLKSLNALNVEFVIIGATAGKIGFPELMERKKFFMPLWRTSS